MIWKIWNRDDEITSLVHQYHPMLLAYIVGKTGNLSVSEDIAQEVWARILKIDFTQVKNQRAYLFQIANNLVIDHFRKKATGEKVRQNHQGNGTTVNAAEIRLEHEDAKNKLTGILTAEEYLIFELESEGYENKDIASRLNMKPKTVANRRSLIKQKLKEHWND